MTFLKGFLIGLANIIPGVSGGTLALILGIYKRVIDALHNVGLPLAGAACRALTFRRDAWRRLGRELQRIDAVFLGVLGLGAVAAIAATSRLMEYLLEHQHAPAYAFFFGLVLASMIFPYRYLRRRSVRELISFVLAAVLTVSLTFLVDEEEQVAKVQAKQEMEMLEGAKPGDGGVVSFERPDAVRLGFIGLSAALAISAMVLPGISGSFVLLLLGVYFDLLRAINDRQVIVLGVFAIGILGGLLIFSRIMSVLLNRLYNVTMAFMIGLMAGSLWVLWPFKRVVAVGAEKVYLGNVWPGAPGATELISIVTAGLGAGIVLVSYLISRRHGFEEVG